MSTPATAPQWQPAQEGLGQLVNMFRSSNSPDSAIQLQIHESIQRFKSTIPDFNCYLVFIFARLKNEQEYVRTVAGLVLKNNIRDQFSSIPQDYQNYIKTEVLSSVGDPIPSVRKAVASIITTICSKQGLLNWPTLLPALHQYLDSTDMNLVDGAFGALSLLCEDYAHKMDDENLGRPLNALIPKFLTFFKSPHESQRRHAITCINQFIAEMPNALILNIQTFLQGIFYLANDTSADVRKKVCQALVMLAEVRIDYLLPFMDNVVQYIIHAAQDTNDDVALEATEFFSAIAETKACRSSLTPHLQKIVQVLLSRMVYSDSDPTLIQAEEEDEAVPDQNKDIKPFFHKSASKAHMPSQNQTPAQQPQSQGEDSDDEYDDDDDDDDDEVSEWNIRKCSAAGIDILSLVFQEEILPFIIQVVQERINDKSDWKIRESAVLTLGAIAEGCLDGMKSHLPQLVPFLISFLGDVHPLIRSITCWTLSRYARWIVKQKDTNIYFKPLVFELLQRILDKSKKVQEAACSAFATLEEEAGRELVPYLSPILTTLMTAFGKYQAKNLLILYDSIGTLADVVGSDLNKPEHINVIMPPLIGKWNSLVNEDKNLLPLLECLTSISTALGVGFQHFAQPVFQRCLGIVDSTLLKEQMASRNEAEYPDKEFLVCSLDLISGIIDALQSGSESLITGSTLVPNLIICAKDNRPDVRQSTFAMVGDLAKHCMLCIKPHVHEIIPLLIQNFSKDYMAVCNNSAWALGEIAIRIGEEVKPYVMVSLEKLVPLLSRSNSSQNLLENLAICIGRLGLVCPDVASPVMDKFLEAWCRILVHMRDDPEKDSTFRGLCKMIQMNPNGAVKSFVFVCDAIGSWEHPQQDLHDNFYRILHGFKGSMDPNAWTNYFNSFPSNLQKVLKQKYQL